MNFFGYIPMNAVIAQMIGGFLIGMVVGLCAPSEYEQNQLIDDRQKVWFWKKHHEISIKYIFIHLIKITIAVFLLTYINVQITRMLDVAPMAKHSPHLYILGIAFVITFILFKYIRYLYFRYKLDKILENEIHK